MPGYGDSEECHEIRDMLDFTLHTWDVVDALGLKDPILVGHSMGGMIAAEMAAVCPNDVSRLALIAPAGLWLDDHPVADIFTKLPYEMPALLFHDEEAGKARLTTGLALDDPKFLQAFLVTNARQLGMAGRLLFPIPERGLSERLYRVKAKTILVWGDSDSVVSPVYAHEFKRLIKGAQLVSIPEAGHMVLLEKTARDGGGDPAAGVSRHSGRATGPIGDRQKRIRATTMLVASTRPPRRGLRSYPIRIEGVSSG